MWCGVTIIYLLYLDNFTLCHSFFAENKVNNDYKEIGETCLRNKGISDACVEFVKTGKMENDKCLKECSNNGCIEKLKECLDKIGLEKMQE